MTSEFQVEIPEYRIEETRKLASEYPLMSDGLPFAEGTHSTVGEASKF